MIKKEIYISCINKNKNRKKWEKERAYLWGDYDETCWRSGQTACINTKTKLLKGININDEPPLWCNYKREHILKGN